jgi:hypothetical protein
MQIMKLFILLLSVSLPFFLLFDSSDKNVIFLLHFFLFIVNVFADWRDIRQRKKHSTLKTSLAIEMIDELSTIEYLWSFELIFIFS